MNKVIYREFEIKKYTDSCFVVGVHEFLSLGEAKKYIDEYIDGVIGCVDDLKKMHKRIK